MYTKTLTIIKIHLMRLCIFNNLTKHNILKYTLGIICNLCTKSLSSIKFHMYIEFIKNNRDYEHKNF